MNVKTCVFVVKCAVLSSIFFTSVRMKVEPNLHRDSTIDSVDLSQNTTNDVPLHILEINYLINRATKKSSSEALIKVRNAIMSKIKKKKGNDKALIIGLSHGIIESLEGDYREKAYDDGYGTYTIGFGNTYIHDKHSGEIRRVRKGDVLTKSEGILNQRKLINTNYETVMTFLIQNNMDHRISAYGKAALVSFVYNIGMDRFNNSDVASLIKHGRLSKAVKAIKASFITSKGVLSEGLVTRRDIESLLLSLSINNPYKTLLTYRN